MCYHLFERDAATVRDLIRQDLPSAQSIGEPAPALPELVAEVTDGLIHRIARSAHDALVMAALRRHAPAHMREQHHQRERAAWSGLSRALFDHAYLVAADSTPPGRGYVRAAEAAIREYLRALAEDERSGGACPLRGQPDSWGLCWACAHPAEAAVESAAAAAAARERDEDARWERLERFVGVDAPAGQWPWED